MAGRREKSLDPNMPPPLLELTESLRELRHASGLTLQELSGRASYSPSSLSRALNGDGVPSVELFEALLDACEVPEGKRGQWWRLFGDAAAGTKIARQPQAADPAESPEQLRAWVTTLYKAAGRPSVRHLEAASGVPRSAIHRLLTGSYTRSTPIRAVEVTDVLATLTPAEDREHYDGLARRVRNAIVHHYDGAAADSADDGDISADPDAHQQAQEALRRLARRATQLDHRLADAADPTADEDVTRLLHQLREDATEAHNVLCATCRSTDQEFRPLTPEEKAAAPDALGTERVTPIPDLPDRPRVPASVQTKDAPNLVGSVQRAMRLLEVAAAHKDGAPAKALAREAGLALPVAYHLLRTLTHEGYLRRKNGVFVLGDATRQLGAAPSTRDGATVR